MGVMASQITSPSIVCSAVCSGADQRQHQSSATLAFVKRIHRWPVNSPHKGPVTPKMFSFNDVVTKHMLQMDNLENICMPWHWSQPVYGEIVPGYELGKHHNQVFRMDFDYEDGQNGRDGVSDHQPLNCLLSCLFRRRSKTTSKLRDTCLCEGNSPVTGEFPSQRASNAENVFI